MITAQETREEQYFIDHCRFKSLLIASRGIETKGFLFELLPRTFCVDSRIFAGTVSLNDGDRYTLRPWTGARTSLHTLRHQMLSPIHHEVSESLLPN